MPALRLAAALAAALVLSLLTAAGAQAVTCSTQSLTDSTGATYDFTSSALAVASNRDALEIGTPYYDPAMTARFDSNDDCALEDGGRELVWPAQDVGGATVQPKAYVPSSGTAFLRHAYVISNPTANPVSLRLHRFSRPEYSGADVDATSNGDGTATAADDWMTFRNPANSGDPAVALVWQGASTLKRTAAEQVYASGATSVTDGFADQQVRWQPIALAPGETAVVLSFAALRSSLSEARSVAGQLADSPDAAFAAMSDTEVRAVRNFVPADADRDGIGNAEDNCDFAVNPDQANYDGDAEGDACDADDDNDGLSDTLEAEFRTDPRNPDSDGDGVRDRDDACPTVAGGPPGGCPLGGALTILGRVPPKATTARLRPTRDRRAPFRFRVTGTVVPPDALSAQQACKPRGLVQLRVKRGSRTLATRRIRLRATCTYSLRVTLRSRRRFGARTTALSLRVTWLGNRFLEPKLIQVFRARVR